MHHDDSIFKKVLDVTKEGFWVLDRQHKTTYVNQSLCHLLGYEYDEFIGKSPLDFVDEKNRAVFNTQLSKIESTEHRTYTIELRTKNGENIPTHFNSTTVYDENDTPIHSFALITDMRQELAVCHELEDTNEKLKVSQNLINTILNTQENLVVVTDGHKIIHANIAFLNFFNVATLEELIQDGCLCVWMTLKPTFVASDKHCHNWLREIERSGWRVDGSDSDGVLHNFVVVSNPYPNEDGMFVVTFNDVTSLQKERDYFVHLASTDTLTSLHNRAKLNETILSLINKSLRYTNIPFCVIMFDIDFFKKVNDTYGHQMGDNILKDVSLLVQSNIRASDFIARYGGEEFVILTPNTDIEQAIQLADKLRQKIAHTLFYDLQLTCSFGVYQFTQGDTSSSLIDKVDKLLYQAKQSGRNRVEYILKGEQ